MFFVTYTNDFFSILPIVTKSYPIIQLEEKFKSTLYYSLPLY